MPSPKSPITQLGDLLKATPALAGRSQILVGKNHLVGAGSPGRIVIFPTEGPYSTGSNILTSFADVNLKCVAHLWGSDLDHAWELRDRFLQGLWQQGVGNGLAPMAATPAQAGFKFEVIDEVWDTSPDTAQQGNIVEVTFAILATAGTRFQLGEGQVDATALHGLHTTLTAPMTASDGVATVVSTAGFAASGEISIDGEKITYSGLTATTFTGLTRGFNGTTAAAHGATATVTQ